MTLRAEGRPGFSAVAAVIAVVIILQVIGSPATTALRLEPALVSKEPWRLVTGHWVHLTVEHTALNVATFALYALLFQSLRVPSSLAAIGLIATAAVSAGVLVFHAHLAWYVGLSGVLYGWLAGGAVLDRRRSPHVSGLVLIGLTGKLIYDQAFGTPAQTEALVGGPVLESAHMYGAIGGGLAAGLYEGWARARFARARASSEA